MNVNDSLVRMDFPALLVVVFFFLAMLWVVVGKAIGVRPVPLQYVQELSTPGCDP